MLTRRPFQMGSNTNPHRGNYDAVVGVIGVALHVLPGCDVAKPGIAICIKGVGNRMPVTS